jgi:protein-L-isoaspartate(D-aspartate) O-methyltransferase
MALMKATAAKKRDLAGERHAMVERQIVRRGVRNALVLEAMRSVPRELFLREEMREFAYEDSPLPIEEGQRISQPFIVALMSEALLLNGAEKVLEIGTGSGYAAAVLGQIAAEVYTVERYSQLATKAAATLTRSGINNVHVRHGDGTLGWPDHAPYDGIVVAAGGPRVPEALKSQRRVQGSTAPTSGPHSRVTRRCQGARCPAARRNRVVTARQGLRPYSDRRWARDIFSPT